MTNKISQKTWFWLFPPLKLHPWHNLPLAHSAFVSLLGSLRENTVCFESGKWRFSIDSETVCQNEADLLTDNDSNTT